MAKNKIGFHESTSELMRAFEEDRVLLVGQGKEGPPNPMAIGWGQIGILWRRPVFTALVRPSRYTYRLIEETGDFTVNIVPGALKDTVQFCGTVSGRDRKKLEEKKLTPLPSSSVNTPILKEGILHYECKVIYKTDLIPGELDKSIKAGLYPKGDYHRLYFGEILACVKED
jgi:flavin reductase (DIM6/NTAB) family NADH-FMN oxidoreductase RutF